MISFLSGIWKYIVAGLSAVIAILGAALLVISGQRDRAKEAAQDAKDGLKAVSAARETEQSTQDAQAEAREQSAEVQREHEDRPADTRPDGDFRR